MTDKSQTVSDSDTSDSDSDSDETSSDNESIIDNTKSNKDLKSKINDEAELFDKLKEYNSGQKQQKKLEVLTKNKLKLILQTCKRVYSGKISKFKTKHVKYFKQRKDSLHKCFYGITISSMKRGEILEKLKHIATQDDGKLLTSMLYYSSKI